MELVRGQFHDLAAAFGAGFENVLDLSLSPLWKDIVELTTTW